MRLLLNALLLILAATPAVAGPSENAALKSIAIQSVDVQWRDDKHEAPSGLVTSLHDGLTEDLVGTMPGSTPVTIAVSVIRFGKGLVGERFILADVHVVRAVDGVGLAHYKRLQVGAARTIGGFIREARTGEKVDPSVMLGKYLAQAIRRRLPNQKPAA